MQKLLGSLTAIVSIAILTNTVHALNLPSTDIMVDAHAGADSTFDFILHDVPGGFDVGNNTYLGWCVELRNINNQTGDGRHARLVSTLSPDLPAPYVGKPWDKINYILNHKQGHWGDVQ